MILTCCVCRAPDYSVAAVLLLLLLCALLWLCYPLGQVPLEKEIFNPHESLDLAEERILID